MSSLASTFMLLVCAFVWGGFAVLVVRAFRSESAKRRSNAGAGPS